MAQALADETDIFGHQINGLATIWDVRFHVQIDPVYQARTGEIWGGSGARMNLFVPRSPDIWNLSLLRDSTKYFLKF